jgi:hypothetical protein
LFLLLVSRGKMGERSLRSKTVFVYGYGELLQLTEDPTIVINSILPISDDCLQISFTPTEDADVPSITTSLIHAAYTTAHGRLLLYHFLDTVGERAAYHDTGKILYF